MKFNKSVIQWNFKDEDMGFKKHAIIAHQKKKQNNNVLTKDLRNMWLDVVKYTIKTTWKSPI